MAYNNAKNTLEVAEIAVKEYEEGIYPQDLQTVQGEIKRAELGLKKTEARLERTRRARQRLNEVIGRKERATESGDIVAELDLDDRLDAADQALRRERLSLENAQSKLNVLQNYTKEKTLKELNSEVQKARSDLLTKKLRWDLEKAKEAKLEKQIELCKIYAPAEGIVYSTYGGSEVRERMKVMEIFSSDPMLVNVNVRESMVARLKPGHKARITVQTPPGETCEGVVESVASSPDQSNAKINMYQATVKLDQTPKGVRPGYGAIVEIDYEERNYPLIVPREAVLHFDRKAHVAVIKPDGGFEFREVTLGDTNEALFEIKQGLKPGERVSLQPELLPREDKKVFGAASSPASRKS